MAKLFDNLPACYDFYLAFQCKQFAIRKTQN